MEYDKNNVKEYEQATEGESAFSFQLIYTTVLLYWQWIVASVVICLGLAYVYLRYATPIYQAEAKMLVKDEENQRGRYSSNMLATATNLGIMTNSAGIDNEMEILKSSVIAEEAIRDLKLYVIYKNKGRIKNRLVYKTQAINVDMDAKSLNKLQNPIKLKITHDGDVYKVTGKYYAPVPEDEEAVDDDPIEIDQTFTKLPARINTLAGVVTLTSNAGKKLKDGKTMYATIYPPSDMAKSYAKALNVEATSKTTSIAVLSINDPSWKRATDYLDCLVEVYNRQANEDKNTIARKTEQFINGRLERLTSELGSTEGSYENLLKSNKMIEFKLNAEQTMKNADEYDNKLIETNMQISLINSLSSYLDNHENRYQVIPTNIGLTDPSTTQLINQYNKVALERNSLLRTASESNPSIKPLTSQLDEMHTSIKKAMTQTKHSLEIQRKALAEQSSKYQGQILDSPEQQRKINQIGRQQEVQTALYTMLLQKREENSISLAATADKGKLIDNPTFVGKVKPKGLIIMLIALVLGLGIPFGVIYLINFFKYRIENHEDVAKLTSLPIIADVAVASESQKTKGEIVVHENVNNTMEEIFRSMRTNLQFMLKEGEKVIMSTSSIAGEGKTFITSNLAISFALLGKKVVLVGLDIRKPRLAELFQIKDSKHGITPLLAMSNPTAADLEAQIINSGVNKNLDLLMAGPIPPNPAELVERKQLDTVIDMLKEKYDYVFIDTAPVGLVTDTLQIGRVANVTVAVCRADYTPKENIMLFNSLAEEKKLNNMAVVINGIDMSKKKHGYHYGYGKYGKYGKYGHYGHYGNYGNYGTYGNYSNSHYGDKNDNSIKL